MTLEVLDDPETVEPLPVVKPAIVLVDAPEPVDPELEETVFIELVPEAVEPLPDVVELLG